MTEHQQRQQLIDFAKQLNSSGLSAGKSGNISVRCEQGCLITPSGVSYSELQAADIVKINLEGESLCNSTYPPSSEWHFHTGIYKQRPEQAAVVHAHPSYCTALACTQRPIPAFHYMVAIAGGDHIPLAPYALFGTEQLSDFVTKALCYINACLLENHGMIAIGKSLPQAFDLAVEVEELAKQYHLALTLGKVKILTDEEMVEAIEQFKHYGQRLNQ
ncbi:MAG: L-fuculose-phosphate aldolase [Pseudohongiellaceae bacterium]